MAVNTAAMIARTRFGAELKRVRLATRVNGEKVQQIHVARAMGLSRYDRYSRMERGETWPNDAEWLAIHTYLRMDLETRVRLETMRREGMSIASAWWTEFDNEFHESLIEFVAYEDSAQKITTCAGNIVPGLLQTTEYGRTVTSLLAKSTMSPHLVERSVELRANRRRAFGKPNPPITEAIIGEAALRQKVGGAAVMVRQLDSLVLDATQGHVTFRVIPFEAGATLTYMFHLFEFGGANENPIAAFDAMTGMSFWRNPKEVRGIRGLVDSLKSLALPPLDSLEKIRAIRKEMSRD
ncbi:helix-turn-helix transcriptional regulator [Streptomyces sp. ISL-96]|uniref:helix-turn-helix domain-containing protein n=1 Tax=Streptomyces sp. ISL-96 TaxID=2819191 RepID=UPI001BE6F094|nr:helix-turn-helix transcriptional regulator [Streptomyces sp. ISL-96]MBT2491683.1 helix-turn-helix transcriptional regulator [Streptomyces sp. ISL-96]